MLLSLLLMAPLVAQKHRNHEEFFSSDAECYNRKKEGYLSKVDSHNHFRPFGGRVIPFDELMIYFQKCGVRFVNAYGIGQTLPSNNPCTYYLDCPDVPVTPSLRNDFVNAANFLEYNGDNTGKLHDPLEGDNRINLVLSMTFPDLTKPSSVVDYIELMDSEYPGLFKWMGEVNLKKQALFNNKQPGVVLDSIKGWKPFMDIIRERKMPINIHSDIGNDSVDIDPNNRTKYLYLMEAVLEQYNDNKIVWSHMGLSKELVTLPANEHIAILKRLLDKHQNLTLDLSWDVLWDSVFVDETKRSQYIKFINEYPTRFIPGTDFVASREGKDIKTYAAALEKTSRINCEMSDEAFRNIALGQNYFDLLELDYEAPDICEIRGRRKCRFPKN